MSLLDYRPYISFTAEFPALSIRAGHVLYDPPEKLNIELAMAAKIYPSSFVRQKKKQEKGQGYNKQETEKVAYPLTAGIERVKKGLDELRAFYKTFELLPVSDVEWLLIVAPLAYRRIESDRASDAVAAGCTRFKKFALEVCQYTGGESTSLKLKYSLTPTMAWRSFD